MKFIAILKDSLREAIDAKVFYVMVGLSLLVILVACTATFTPTPGGKMLMETAAVPLSLDLANFDPAEAQGDPLSVLRLYRGAFKVEEVYPLDNAEDLPGSTFRVVVRPAAGGLLSFLSAAPRPDKVLGQIRERFGVLDDWRIAEVVDVTHKGGKYLIDARVTPTGRRLWPHSFSLFFGALPVFRDGVPLGLQLFGLENYVVNQIGAWVAILVSIIITAFFVPNMLRKGTVDLLIVKPIHRTTLLLYKYVGGLLFIFLNTAVAVGGVWLALSMRSGIWTPGFLVSIPAITFFFAILYAVSTLFGVLTRSPIVSILMTIGVWFVLFLAGTITNVFDVLGKQEKARVRHNASQNASQMAASTAGLLADPAGAGPLLAVNVLHAQTNRLKPYETSVNRFAQVVAAIHFVLPRTSDVNTLMTMSLLHDTLPRFMGVQMALDRKISWGETLTVSGVFIALVLGVSCWWFATKDY
jgi:ABC-type transport system involved in multi-copper enzyme maturation permease subunit